MNGWGIVAAAQGFLAVAFGAFGAHAIKDKLASLEDGAQRMQWWQTASQYHLIHAVALLAVALLIQKSSSAWTTASATAFCIGTIIFSGTLYLMTLTGIRWLGAITPIGGTLLLAGWILLGISFLKTG